MTAVTKFMFDLEFAPEIDPADDSSASHDGADADTADTDPDDGSEDGEIIEEEEELPGYSEAQLEDAKAESFEAGKLEGARESASTIEKETLMTVQAISLHITELFGHQESANSVLLRDGIEIAASIVRKLFPRMNEQNALHEIDRLVEHTLLRLIEEPRVVIRVNPDLLDALDRRIGDLKAGAGYEGRIVMKDDPSLPYGDCRMEWGDGSAERNVESLWQSIDQIIEGNLGKTPKPTADEAAVELSALGTPESEAPEISEKDSDAQVDRETIEANLKKAAPLEVMEGESMLPEEDSGIVGAIPKDNVEANSDNSLAENATHSETPESEPEDPEASTGKDE